MFVYQPPQPKPTKGKKPERAPKRTQSLAYEEFDACARLGLPYAEYVKLPGIDAWLDDDDPTALTKCKVVMWYRVTTTLEHLFP